MGIWITALMLQDLALELLIANKTQVITVLSDLTTKTYSVTVYTSFMVKTAKVLLLQLQLQSLET